MTEKISFVPGVSAIAIAASLAFAPAPAAAADAQGASAGAVTAIPSGFEASNGIATVRVTALSDDVLRVRIARGGNFPEDASWAVAKDVRGRSVPVQATADGFATKSMIVHVDPATLALTVTDPGGKTIVADLPDPLLFDGKGFHLRMNMPDAEHYYAMGDKTGMLDRRGYTNVNWNTDFFGFPPSGDPIYKSIPFFIGLGGEGGAYGFFLDNTWRSTFDFGHSRQGTVEVSAVDGPIDYYLIAGPTMPEVTRRYTDLTGKAPLAPLWALGYQQSRYSYMSDAEVRDIAGTFRKDDFPLDVIWLDIDYQDHYRPFTVNTTTFPDMKKLNGDMLADGIRLVAITDLHIAYLPDKGYAPYDSGAAADYFVHKPDGSVYVAPVWPGLSVFPDFTREPARKWWGSLYKDFVADGFSGFWNDMNEPAVFDTPPHTMPIENIDKIDSDDFAPRDATQAEIHNVYGMENSRATFEGLQVLKPNYRPFVMTRATYAGGQRYAATWTGDNSSTWDHLRLSVEQLINLGLSGFSYAGADVGGFAGGPSADLLTRWFEVGAFTPVFRDHSAVGTPRAEPWVDGPEHLAIRKHYVEERYRLMPYLYSVADQNARTGDPIMRPVFYDYPDALGNCDQQLAFTVGSKLLVWGPPRPESPQEFETCLPAGGWFDYWTGQKVAENRFMQKPKLDHLPVYIRAGTILPRQPVVQSTAQVPQGPLSLDVYPGQDCSGALYLDDGLTVNGANLRQSLRCTVEDGRVTLHFDARQGQYKPWWSSIAVTVHGWDGGASVKGAGASKPVADAASHSVSFTIPDQPRAADIVVARD